MAGNARPLVEKVPVSCPVCTSAEHRVVYEPWHDVHDPLALYGAASGVTGTQRIVRCVDCGMIYENPRYPEDVIRSGYESSREGGHDSQYPMRVESFYHALRRNAAQLPPRGARVLDVGTAGGAFLEAARRFGYDAQGLEPSRYLVEQGARRGLDVRQGTIEAHTFDASSFDLVCLWDVIEHLCHPRAALERLRPLLRADGRLLVNYPDIGTWQARFAGRRFWWIISVHLHHFSRVTLKALLDRTGFEAVSFRRYWQRLELGYLEGMAAHYGVPLARVAAGLTPPMIRRLPLPYYASQTTAIARLRR